MRVRRYITASSMSLLLSVLAALLWVWSRGNLDRFWLLVEPVVLGAQSGGGQVGIGFATGLRDLPPIAQHIAWDHVPGEGNYLTNGIHPDQPGEWTRAGFGFQRQRWGNIQSFLVVVPCWFVLVLFLVLPVFAGARAWRRGRDPVRRCRHCRYDLTGNVSGICPECGAAFRPPMGVPDEAQ